MKTLLIAFGVGVTALLVLALVLGLVYVTYSNTEVRLRNAAAAQQKSNEAIFDNTWKTISQQAQVTDAYKESFKEVWKEIVTGQSTAGRANSLQVFVNRINPKFSSSLFKKLMNTIESQRKEFLNNQRRLIDIKREHDNVITTIPGCWFLGSRPPLNITIITSTKTQDVFEQSKEDDLEVFPSKKK